MMEVVSKLTVVAVCLLVLMQYNGPSGQSALVLAQASSAAPAAVVAKKSSAETMALRSLWQHLVLLSLPISYLFAQCLATL